MIIQVPVMIHPEGTKDTKGPPASRASLALYHRGTEYAEATELTLLVAFSVISVVSVPPC
jgi:hypothetical protein